MYSKSLHRWGEPQPQVDRLWLTTASVARRLRVTAQWVRWLARHGELHAEVTESGQRVFQRGDVQRYLVQRSEEQARRRSTRWLAIRLRMVKADLEPRQVTLPLFGRPKLKLAGSWSERSLSDAKVKRPRSGVNRRGSDKAGYVNRKAATR